MAGIRQEAFAALAFDQVVACLSIAAGITGREAAACEVPLI